MKLPEQCIPCLLRGQKKKSSDEAYLNCVKEIIENRGENDCAPFLAYKFNECYEKLFGKRESIAPVKRRFNDFVLSMEKQIKEKIEKSEDPLLTSLVYARIGNYIDFATVSDVNDNEFLELLNTAKVSENDLKTYDNFLMECSRAESFLLICDNCGEIVLDRFFMEEFRKKFPRIHCKVMVRGGEVQNDVTYEDAVQSGMNKVAQITNTGLSIAGCIYDIMPSIARRIINESDVVMAKGQGNYESLSGNGIHVFYSFLCKCEYFMDTFNAKRLEGMFIEDNR